MAVALYIALLHVLEDVSPPTHPSILSCTA